MTTVGNTSSPTDVANQLRTSLVPEEYCVLVEHKIPSASQMALRDRVKDTFTRWQEELTASGKIVPDLIPYLLDQTILRIRTLHTIVSENDPMTATSLIVYERFPEHRTSDEGKPQRDDDEQFKDSRLETLERLKSFYNLVKKNSISATDPFKLAEPIYTNGELAIVDVGVNWICHVGANPDVGGPGGRPREFGPSKTMPKIEMIVPDKTPWSDQNRQGENVYIAVLDTAPEWYDINHAFFDDGTSSELLKTLLSNTPLTYLGSGMTQEMRADMLAKVGSVYVTNPIDPRQGFSILKDSPNWDVIPRNLEGIKHYCIAGHDYPMTDHGLFVSGMIKSILPNANVCLVEVLNKKGISTLESLFAGFIKLWNFWRGEFAERQNRTQMSDIKFVINLSHCLDIGSLGDANHDKKLGNVDLTPRFYRDQLHAEFCKDKDKEIDLEKWYELLNRSVDILRYLFSAKFFNVSRNENLETDNPHIMVAASGNGCFKKLPNGGASTNPKNERRPSPYFPASEPYVMSVGALMAPPVAETNAKWSIADYSNAADDPDPTEPKGVYVLGGNAEAIEQDQLKRNANKTEPGKGLVGLYLEDFPDSGSGGKSTWGMGEWSGTSFATPIITGILASLIAGGNNNPVTRLVGKVAPLAPETDDYDDNSRAIGDRPKIHILKVKQTRGDET